MQALLKFYLNFVLLNQQNIETFNNFFTYTFVCGVLQLMVVIILKYIMDNIFYIPSFSRYRSEECKIIFYYKKIIFKKLYTYFEYISYMFLVYFYKLQVLDTLIVQKIFHSQNLCVTNESIVILFIFTCYFITVLLQVSAFYVLLVLCHKKRYNVFLLILLICYLLRELVNTSNF